MMDMMTDYTHIASHESACCRAAKEWVFAMDAAYAELEGGFLHLSWLYDIYSWGPNQYPFFWCDLLKTRTIDCGVFADLVQTILLHRGIECSRIQRYGLAHESQKALWREQWNAASMDYSHWIVEDTYIYHELLVLNHDGSPLFLDTSNGQIIDDGSPYISPIRYMKQCQPMSIPIVYDKTLLQPLHWTEVSS